MAWNASSTLHVMKVLRARGQVVAAPPVDTDLGAAAAADRTVAAAGATAIVADAAVTTTGATVITADATVITAGATAITADATVTTAGATAIAADATVTTTGATATTAGATAAVVATAFARPITSAPRATSAAFAAR